MLRKIGLLILLMIPMASYGGNREVENGTILYTATAESSDEGTGSFLAQQAAIKLVITECGIAHREIKVFKNNTVEAGRVFVSTAQAGITFESCEEAKRSKGPARALLINHDIINSQELYDEHLKKQLGLDKPKKVVRAAAPKNNQLSEINRKLDSLADRVATPTVNREVIVIQAPPERVPASPNTVLSEKAKCMKKYNGLMQKAYRAASDNYPPGNMAQGDALEYYNDAQAQFRDCK